MRTLLIAVIILALIPAVALAKKITADPNAQAAPQSAPEVKVDARLLQKVTYKAKLRPVANVCADLTQMTGVEFFAGSTPADWRVREDAMTIYAVDISLGDLMSSIARVMKLTWIRSGGDPNWSYRAIEDRSALGDVRDREEKWRKVDSAKRQRALGMLIALDKAPGNRLETLRQTSPDAYKFAHSDAARLVRDFMQAAPQVPNNWLRGGDMKIKASDLSDDAYSAYVAAVQGLIGLGAQGYEGADNEETRGMLDEFQSQARATKIEIAGGTASNPYGSISLAGYSIPLAEIAKAAEPPVPPGMPAGSTGLSYGPAQSYTAEEHVQLPDQPFLHEKLKKKVDSDTISGLVFQLAQASGCAVVTDNFRGKVRVQADETRELGDLIDQIAKAKGMNWKRSDSVIEIWNRDWYDRRESRVSQVWLDSTKRRFIETGTLDLDEMAEIANLTDKQFGHSIRRDKALKQVAGSVRAGRQYLRFYATLSKQQKALLLSARGLGLDDLSQAQHQAALELASEISAPAFAGVDLTTSGVRLALTRTKEGNSYSYILRAHAESGLVPVEYAFKTPAYAEPKSHTDAESFTASYAQ